MFNLTQQRFGHTTVLHCSGKVVFPYATALRDSVRQLLRTRKLVLDLANVITMDAAGLGALVSLHQWAKRTRTEFKLMNVGPKLQFLLNLTRLNTVLNRCSVQEMIELSFCSGNVAAASLFSNCGFTPAPSNKMSQASSVRTGRLQ